MPPSLLHSLFGYDAFVSGLVMSPSGVFSIVTMLFVGVLLGQGTDARWLIAAGLLVMAVGCYWITRMNLYISPEQVVCPRVVLICGLSLIFAPINVAAFRCTPPTPSAPGSTGAARDCAGSALSRSLSRPMPLNLDHDSRSLNASPWTATLTWMPRCPCASRNAWIASMALSGAGMRNRQLLIGFAVCLVLGVSAFSSEVVRASKPLQEAEMAGYLLVPHESVPETYSAGFSLYVAAWPLLREYPGQRFQSGLFGTWMHAEYDGPEPANLYSDIEGGLGWWRDTRFATVTPKFIMGGVALNFSEWANGPGAGRDRDWDKPLGKYGVAQLSPWILWPPDGLNLKQGTCGELVGYGYLPLPLTKPKARTAGRNVPTGDHCWTLFLNTANFKGPVAFFTPYFWSRASVENPQLAGMFLDSRPAKPNKPLQMETQYIPSVLAVDASGETFARIAPTSFPRDALGNSVLVHRITAYNKSALWDAVKAWFEGGTPASGMINTRGACVHTFKGGGGSTWKILPPDAPEDKKVPLAWNSFARPVALDAVTYGYKWNYNLVTKTGSKSGPLVTLPEYFHLVTNKGNRQEWVVARPGEVPAETGLAKFQFHRPRERRPEAYVTPSDRNSSWKKPGPAAGPFHAHLGDGSVVTYYWYRFADQPALLNADLTDAERANLQSRAEKLHRHWKNDRNYLPPPTVGKLAEIDPALIVMPPKGLEIGYVPIVTRQGGASR